MRARIARSQDDRSHTTPRLNCQKDDDEEEEPCVYLQSSCDSSITARGIEMKSNDSRPARRLIKGDCYGTVGHAGALSVATAAAAAAAAALSVQLLRSNGRQRRQQRPTDANLIDLVPRRLQGALCSRGFIYHQSSSPARGHSLLSVMSVV